jgi:hypothetical protein
MFGRAVVDGAVVGAVNAAALGSVAAGSVAGVSVVVDWPGLEVTSNALGANALRVIELEVGAVDVLDDIELSVLGGWAALVVDERLVPFGCSGLWLPGLLVGALGPDAPDSRLPGVLPALLGELPPDGDGEPVAVVDPEIVVSDSPAPEDDPAAAAAPDESPEVFEPLTGPASADEEVFAGEPAFSVWVAVPDVESPEPVVSAKDIAGVAIAVPTPSAKASAPTRPT